jgi:hypothetical protein
LDALHERIAQLIDSDTADLLLKQNPQAVLAGDRLVQSDFQPTERASFFNRILRRQ